MPGGVASLSAQLGPGPSWTRYAAGPWPEPHDPIYDFRGTPAGWEWLDRYARKATVDLVGLHDPDRLALGHGDWSAGNLRFAHGRVVAAFDWDVVAEDEAVLVGLSAGAFLLDSNRSGIKAGALHSHLTSARGAYTSGRSPGPVPRRRAWWVAIIATVASTLAVSTTPTALAGTTPPFTIGPPNATVYPAWMRRSSS